MGDQGLQLLDLTGDLGHGLAGRRVN